MGEGSVRITFTSAGAPRHGLNLQKQVQRISDAEGWGIETRFQEWNDHGGKTWGYADLELSEREIVWNMGNFGNCFQWFESLKAEEPERQLVAHWIGTDVLQHRDIVEKGGYDPFGSATHIADAPNLQEEVVELTKQPVGYVRTIPPKSYSPVPIVRWDRILAYVPQGREDFFRWTWFVELAADYPGIAFHVMARSGTKDTPPNLIEEGIVEGDAKDRLFESCFLLLRPVEHDGVGLTLIEMAQLGRFVAHSDTRIPHVLPARSVGEIEYQIDRILQSKEPPKPEVRDYYAAEYREERLRDDLDRIRQDLQSHL